MRLSKTNALILLLTAFVLLFVILNTLRLPNTTHLWREIHNAGHTPMFGILALILLGFSRMLLKSRLKKRVSHYLLAFFAASFLGALSEILQIFEPRDADIWDLVRDIVGIIAFLCGYKVFEDYRNQHFDLHRWNVFVPFVTAVILLVGAVTPSILWIGAYSQRNSNFPSIMDFESPLQSMYVTLNSARLDRYARPSDFLAARGKNVGRVEFQPSIYSDFIIEEPVSDWSDYDYLSMDLYSANDTTIQIAVRIEDRHHNRHYEDRYNAVINLEPGSHTISIDLNDIETAPETRQMDMTQMHIIHLFTVGINSPVNIMIDNIRLAKLLSQ